LLIGVERDYARGVRPRAIVASLICGAVVLFPAAPAPAQDTTCVLAPADLTAWWPGDGNAHDIKHGRHGTAGGFTHADGVGRSFVITTDSFVTVPDDPAWTLGSDDFTIDLWVKLNVSGERLPFVAHEESGENASKWIFWYDAVGERDPGPALRFHVADAGAPRDTVVAPWTPDVGVFHHVAVTRKGNDYALYVDGEPLATQTDDGDIPDPDAALRIGRSETASLDGLIDEVDLVSGRAMTGDEIAAIFQAGHAGKCKCAGQAVTILAVNGAAGGTDARDVIRGTESVDEIQGGGGNDLICGAGGDDVLNGGAGKDRILGGAGNDRLGGGPEHDRLLGQSGSDRLFGGDDADLLRGGPGEDFLDGDVGDDDLRGDAGSDHCDGGAGADTIDPSCESQ
jgi:Ca2+-binding RTX toxin-like protein